MILGTATPKTNAHKVKLVAKTGRDHFHFTVEPIHAEVTPDGPSGMPEGGAPVAALRWELGHLDLLIQWALVKEAMRQRRMDYVTALLFLERTGVYFIEADLDLQIVESAMTP